VSRGIVGARESTELWRLAAWQLKPHQSAEIDQEHPDLRSVADIPDDQGRWSYDHEGRSDRDYHTWGVHPTDAPATHTQNLYGEQRHVHYDPKLTSVSDGEFRPELSNRGNRIDDFEPEKTPGTVWRGLSHEEMQAAKANGYFQSNGSYNFGGQEGSTLFDEKPSTAASYANSYAPTQFKPTFTRPAHVIGVSDQNYPRNSVGEVEVPGRVPLSAVTHHYQGNVVSVDPGSYGGYQGQPNPEYGFNGFDEQPSRRKSPSATVQWSPGELHKGGQTTASRWYVAAGPHVREIDPFDVSDEADRAAGLFGDGPDPMAQLAWRHGGEVAMVATPEQHRGNGYATQLFNHVKTHLEPNLHHSPNQTEEGAAWAKQAMPKRFTQDYQHVGGDYMPLDAISHYTMRKGEGFGDEKTPLYESQGKPPLSQQIGDEGYQKPVELITDGQSGIVNDGHHRIDVARQLGHTHVPVSVLWKRPTRGQPMSDNLIEPWLKSWLTDVRNGRQTASRLAALDERHPDHAWQERTFGCAHTACGRVLPAYRTAAAFDDPSGWNNSSAVAPSPIATQGAAAYNSAVGLPQPPPTDFSKPFRTPQSVATVGHAYDLLPTYSPDAVPHFAAMQKELNQQYDHMTNRLGINVQTVDHDPYPDVGSMMADVNNNKRLQVLGTHVTGGHPFFSDEDNDKFRAVHDFYGHAGTGRGFDRHGEEAAFVKHGQMFTPAARNALASETRGQNSSLILNGGFGPQKIATMDPRMMTAVVDLQEYRNERARQERELEDTTDTYAADVKDYFDRGGKPLITYKDWMRGHKIGPGEQADRTQPISNQVHVPDPSAWGTDDDTPAWATIGVRRMARQITSARDHVIMLQPWRTAADTGLLGIAGDAVDMAATHGQEPDEFTGTGPARTSNRLSDEDMARLMEQANEGGYTFRDHPGDGPRPGQGTMVSIPGGERHHEEGPTPQNQHEFLNEHWDAIHSEPDLHGGGWKNPKGFTNDISKLHDDPWDAAGVAFGGDQDAVYDYDGLHHPQGEPEEVLTPTFLHNQIAKGGGRQWYL
jgi:GNAT superfamily N-acetyltransferase